MKCQMLKALQEVEKYQFTERKIYYNYHHIINEHDFFQFTTIRKVKLKITLLNL